MITNPLACRIIEAPNGPRDHDMLAGDFRAGTTILITDLMFRVGTQSGTHGIQMGLADMGWESVEVFKIHDSEAERPLQQFLDTLDKVKQHLSTDAVDDGQITVHLWLSLQFLPQTLKASIFWIAARSLKKWIAAIHFLDRCSYCESICTLLFNTYCCVFSMVKHQFQELEPVHDH